MQENLKNYTVWELLEDDKFLRYIKHPTEENIQYWEKLQQEKLVSESEVERARILIKSIEDFSMRLEDIELQNIWSHIEQEGKSMRKAGLRRRWLKYGALVAVFVLSIHMGWQLFLPEDSDELMMIPMPCQKNSETALVLSGQNPVSIKERESELQCVHNGDVKVNSRIIAVDSQKIVSESTYHQLIVPKGKRSSVTFADGSKIWVNAGSRVVFPANFGHHKRSIYVEGEVFLDVAQDENRPFVLITKQFSVKVYGTSFNVNAYPDEDCQSVVLVTGRVEVKTKNRQKTILTPNDMFLYQHEKTCVKLVDVSDYIAWKDGLYHFCNEQVSHILDRLGKYYGMEILYDDSVQELTCSGKLDLKEQLKDVLKVLAETAPLAYVYSQDSIVVKCTKSNQ